MVALQQWDGKDLPPEEVFAAFVTDLKNPKSDNAIALVGKRLNYEISGIRSKVVATGRKVKALEAGPYKEAVIAIDKVWGNPDTWATIKRSSSVYTPFYLLAMVDMRQGADGSVEQVPADRVDLHRHPDPYSRHLAAGHDHDAHSRLSGRLHAGDDAAEDGVAS